MEKTTVGINYRSGNGIARHIGKQLLTDSDIDLFDICQWTPAQKLSSPTPIISGDGTHIKWLDERAELIMPIGAGNLCILAREIGTKLPKDHPSAAYQARKLIQKIKEQQYNVRTVPTYRYECNGIQYNQILNTGIGSNATVLRNVEKWRSRLRANNAFTAALAGIQTLYKHIQPVTDSDGTEYAFVEALNDQIPWFLNHRYDDAPAGAPLIVTAPFPRTFEDKARIAYASLKAQLGQSPFPTINYTQLDKRQTFYTPSITTHGNTELDHFETMTIHPDPTGYREIATP